MKKTLLFSAIALALTGCSGEEDYNYGNISGSALLSGYEIVDSTLTIEITDLNGLTSASPVYSWTADGETIDDATSSSYTLTADDEGKQIRAYATYTDDDGNDESVSTALSDEIIVNEEGVATLTITREDVDITDADIGVAVADVLSVTVTDVAGTDYADFTYQWLADGVAIDNAAEATYTVEESDEGAEISVQVTYTDDVGQEEDITSESVGPVDSSDGSTDPTGNSVSITDTLDSDAGELRLALGDSYGEGLVSVNVMFNSVETKLAYLGLFGSSVSTSSAVADLKMGLENAITDGMVGIDLRTGSDDITSVAEYAPDTWVNLQVSWNITNAQYTVYVDGTTIGTYDIDNKNSFVGNVENIYLKLSDNSSITTNPFYIDDLIVYSDEAGTTEIFSDNFDERTSGDDLSGVDQYSSATQDAVVSNAQDATNASDDDDDDGDSGSLTTSKVAEITDTDTGDAGELRYKLDSADIISAGKLTVSFNKEEVYQDNGDGTTTSKDAYITVFGTSTSTSNAIVDIRIQEGNYVIRNHDNADLITETFTYGDWNDVEVTWDASAANDTDTAPTVTVSINGGTAYSFTSTSADLTAVSGGAQTISFKVSDNGAVAENSYYVDDFVLYSDVAGTTVQFEDDFESYDSGYDLETSDVYNSSTNEVVVSTVIK